ncbi:AbgT family transporter [bacterium]|nr:AbgT family transporter [bacterium]
MSKEKVTTKEKKKKVKKSLFIRSLDTIESIGNRMPHPATLFAFFVLLIMIISEIVVKSGITAVHPGTGETIHGVSLLSGDGLRWLYTHATDNFVKFPPLGVVLVVMIGIGVAEGTGLISALLRQLVLGAPKRLITAAVVTAGILSHLASSAGYVLLIPLGAMIFVALKRHPMAGIAAAFCGVSGGFGANFLIGSIDPILAGLTESAAQIIRPEMTINPAVNFFFMLASAIMIVIVGTFVTEKIVEPRLGKYEGTSESFDQLTSIERKGLRFAGLSMLVTFAIFLSISVPVDGLLRNGGSFLASPFMKGLITFLFVFFLVPGTVYGITIGTIRSDKEMVKHMTNSMKGLAGYIVLVFFAAQFVYCFKHSNLGVLLAIKGAELLQSVGFTGIGLIVAFVILSAFINLFMGSASAKWAIMAPIFVPMFMLLGWHPGITQAAFRIGDSVTNIITPMMSYFALIVAFAQKYDEKYGIGTIIATMLPYTVVLSIVWIILISIWMAIGLPTGPGAPIHM